MGYNTLFKGELKFKTDPTIQALGKLNAMLGEDFREHKEWAKFDGGARLSYIDLVLTKDFAGLRWNDATEKTYDLDKIVTALVGIMREDFPDFSLTGTLSAQGEDAEDRWDLVMEPDGMHTRKVKVPIPGTKVRCPSCDHTFYVE